MIILYLLLFFVLAFILTKAADLTLDSIKSISRTTGTKTFVLSALILSLATSLPELFVGVTSALEGEGSLSFGNILGANITNILLVAGVSAAIAGGVVIHGEKIMKEFLLVIVAAVLPLFLLLDGRLSRVDGLILLAVYFAYTLSFFKESFVGIGTRHLSAGAIMRFIKNAEEVEKRADRSIGHLLVGVAALLFISDVIVQVATRIASSLSIPLFVVGLLLLSLGTTLPEMVVSFRSLRSHAGGVFIGNILGSIVINSTLIVGIVSVIDPISSINEPNYLLTGAILILSVILFWFFARTKHILTRRESLVLLFLYLVFVVVQFV